MKMAKKNVSCRRRNKKNVVFLFFFSVTFNTIQNNHCHKKGDNMVCLFDDRWPENVSNNKNHPFYSYITRKEEDKSI